VYKYLVLLLIYNGSRERTELQAQLQDLTPFNLAAEVLHMNITVIIYYILVSFEYWCVDSLKMAEFLRNM
jgi:hypothetical protein